MEYQRNLPDGRMVNTHRAMDSELLQTRADLLHNRQVLRSQRVVRNGFSRLLLDYGRSRSNPLGPKMRFPEKCGGFVALLCEFYSGLHNCCGAGAFCTKVGQLIRT